MVASGGSAGLSLGASGGAVQTAAGTAALALSASGAITRPPVVVRASNSYYTTGAGGATQSIAIPGTPVVGDPIGIWITCSAQTTTITTPPTGWTLEYSGVMGTASRTFLRKKYATADGSSVSVTFNATPNCSIAIVVLDGSVHSDFGTIGKITTRSSSSSSSTALAAGSTSGPNLVVFHEKTTSQSSCTVSGVSTIVDQLPVSGNSGSVYVGYYDTSGGTLSQTASYGIASANGAGYQVPVIPVSWAPGFADSFPGANSTPWDSSKWIVTVAGATTSDVQSNAGHVAIGSSAGVANRFSAAAVMAPIADADAVFAFNTADSVAGYAINVALRSDGLFSSNNTYPQNGYFLVIQNNSLDVTVLKSIAGVVTTLTTATGLRPSLTGLTYCRFRVSGSTVEGRMWANGATEPGTWGFTLTDTSIPAQGTFQVQTTAGASNSTGHDFYLSNVTVEPVTAAAIGTASLNLTASGTAHSTSTGVSGNAALTLTAAGGSTTGGGNTGTAALSLTAQGSPGPAPSPAAGTASLNLTASGAALAGAFVNTYQAAFSQTITLAKPAVSDGQTLFAACLWRTTGGTLTPPTGWTEIPSSAADYVDLHLFYKNIPSAAAETATSYAFTTSATPLERALGVIWAESINSAVPIDISTSQVKLSSVSTVAMPGVSTTYPSDLLLDLVYTTSTSATAILPATPTGMTQLAQINQPNNAGTLNASLSIFRQQLTSSGATGTRTSTLSGSAAGVGGLVVALSPVPVTSSGAGTASLTLGASGNTGSPSVGAGTAALTLGASGGPARATALGTARLSLQTNQTTPVQQWMSQPVWYCAHRGGSADFPEETLYGYGICAGWNKNLALEVSVWQSSDGVWVCSHDQSTLRVFGTDFDIPTSAWASAFTDDFSSYTLGASYPDGASIGSTWIDRFSGGGAVAIINSPDGGKALQMSPAVATTSGDTHAALVTSTQNFLGNYHVQAKFRTTAQLRTGSAPNAWEAAWLVWGYQDTSHFYNLVLKPNGWEVDKEVNIGGSQSQVFLASGTTPLFPIGTTYTVDVTTVVTAGVPTFTISVNGTFLATVTDTDTTNPPILSGAIGLYTEDATVDWEYVTATGGLSTLRTTVGNQPIAKMTDVLDAYATGSRVLFVDNKGNQNNSAFLSLIGSYGGPARFVIKGFCTATGQADTAATLGYQRWGYYYDADVPTNLPNTQSHWSLLGMDYTATTADWTAVTSYGKPVIAHIVPTLSGAVTAFSRGAKGIMASGVMEVVPNDTATSTAFLSLNATGGAQASLVGSTAALDLEASSPGIVSASASANLTLTAAADIRAAIAAGAFLDLEAATAASSALSATGSIELVAAGAALPPAARGAAGLSLTALLSAATPLVSGTALLSLLASGHAAGGPSATAVMVLSAVAPGRAPVTGAAALSLVASGHIAIGVVGTAHLSLVSTSSGLIPVSGHALLLLTAHGVATAGPSGPTVLGIWDGTQIVPAKLLGVWQDGAIHPANILEIAP